MRTEQLVRAAMAATKIESARAFARHVGVSHVAVGKWLSGESVPTFEQAAELATIAGLPPVPTAAQVRLESPEGAKHRAVLRRLANAALIVLALAPGMPRSAHAGTLNDGPSMHYAK